MKYLVGFLILANEALFILTCSCMPSNPHNGYCEARYVFIVNSSKVYPSEDNMYNYYTTEILKVLRSSEPVKQKFTNLKTPTSESMCGTSLPLNQKILISAYQSESGSSEFMIDMCDPLRRLYMYNTELENFGKDFDCRCREATGYKDLDYDPSQLCSMFISCFGDTVKKCTVNESGRCEWQCLSKNVRSSAPRLQGKRLYSILTYLLILQHYIFIY